MQTSPLLQVENLNIAFDTEQGIKPVVKDVNFFLLPGEKFGLLGESGSGKSVTALSIMRLLPRPDAKMFASRFYWQGTDLQTLSDSEFHQHFRWKKIAFAFQETSAAFNPVLSIGDQFLELFDHKKEAWPTLLSLLKNCGFDQPQEVCRNYPHRLSGGMKQRLMLAMALVHKPQLLITDEPTSAIDSSLKGKILQWIERWTAKNNMTWLLISHDINLVGKTCDRVAVFYAGRIVEMAKAQDLLAKPMHPYTQGLIQAKLTIGQPRMKEIPFIPGQVPKRIDAFVGCVFQNRCRYASERCKKEEPPLTNHAQDWQVACFHPLK